jgi:hypothetical protein
MSKLFKIIFVCVVAYGLLYWAVSNPNSASNVKETIEATAGVAVEKAKDIADNLTDEE